MPPLPGAHQISPQSGLFFNALMMACSRPPPPTTNIFLAILQHSPKTGYFPSGFSSYNLSVTFGDTSPCRRGFGIPQTLPLRQRLPYQGSWHCEAMTERLYHIPRFRSVSRLPERYPSYNLSVSHPLDSSPWRKDSLRPEGDVANSDRGRTTIGKEAKFAQCQSLSYQERCHRR